MDGAGVEGLIAQPEGDQHSWDRRGADSGVVLCVTRFEVVGPNPDKRLKIEEILAMLKQTTWAGYG